MPHSMKCRVVLVVPDLDVTNLHHNETCCMLCKVHAVRRAILIRCTVSQAVFEHGALHVVSMLAWMQGCNDPRV